MTKNQVENQEEEYFVKWLESMKARGDTNLSFFEQNLEVWRQLWRCCEMSDILLVVCDIRNPLLHFPPTLYDYIVKKHKKQLIVVLNKIDLVDDQSVHEWKDYFEKTFPGIKVTTFSCNPKSSTHQKVNLRRFYRAVGVLDVLKACKSIGIPKKVQVEWDDLIETLKVDLEQRDEKAAVAEAKAMNGRGGNRENKRRHGRRRKQIENQDSDSEDSDEDDSVIEQIEQLNIEDENPKNYITIGLIGHPNVGKSSLINAFKGKKFVSVSKTPGHTKHFQTIFLSNTVRLCDCPGLVFPSFIPKEIQVLSGIYNIAQVQEPLSCIRFLAERVPIIKQLHLEHPEENEDDFQWSPWAISEAFAFQKGFLNAKSGRPDIHRGANLILRMNFDGRILLSFKPPGFYSRNHVPQTHDSIPTPNPHSGASSVEELRVVSKSEKKRQSENCLKN